MKISSRAWIAVLVLLLIGLPFLAACSSDDDDEAETSANPTQVEDVEITIGHITDMTGPGAAAFTVVNAALEDAVRHFNEQNLIPGAELKVLHYDGQMDPSKDLPGYEWLKQNGVDVIFTGVPVTPVTLKSRLEADKMPLFALTSNETITNPPGWIFSMTTDNQPFIYSLLKWIAENDPAFPKDRPAKIGVADWEGPYGSSIIAGMEAYCKAHPKQYRFAGGYLTAFSVTWGSEIEALKDCDYVMPPSLGIGTTSFIAQYRDAGGKGKFICFDTHMGFLGMIVESSGWESIDGTILGFLNLWWNEDREIPNLAKTLLNKYHPSQVEALTKDTSYLGSFTMWYECLDVLAKAINRVGPANFTPQTVYDTAKSYSKTYDSDQRVSFTDTKRTGLDYLFAYAVSASAQDLARMDNEAHPLIYKP